MYFRALISMQTNSCDISDLINGIARGLGKISPRTVAPPCGAFDFLPHYELETQHLWHLTNICIEFVVLIKIHDKIKNCDHESSFIVLFFIVLSE